MTSTTQRPPGRTGLVAVLTATLASLTILAVPTQAFAAPTGIAAVAVELPAGTIGSNARAISGDYLVGGYMLADEVERAFVYQISTQTFTDISPASSIETDAYAIDGNIVAGYAKYAGGSMRAFAYNIATDTFTNLGLFADQTDPYSSSVAYNVSGNVVVGFAQEAETLNMKPFMYDLAATTPTMVDLHPGGTGIIGGINPVQINGNIINWSETDWSAYAFDLSHPELGAQAVGSAFTMYPGTPGPNYVTGLDFSNNAIAVKLSAGSPVTVTLGTLGGSWAQPFATHGSVVYGYSEMADLSQHLFSYDLNASAPVMTDLGDIGFVPGAAGDLLMYGQKSDKLVAGNHNGVGWVYNFSTAVPYSAPLNQLAADTSATVNQVDGYTAVGYSYGTARATAVYWQIPQPQTVAFSTTAPATAHVGDWYHAVATASSGLTATLSIDPDSTDFCSINSAGVVAFTAIGSCKINADQAGSALYEPATTVSQTVQVLAADGAETLTLDPGTSSASFTDGLLGESSISFTAGTDMVTINVAPSDNPATPVNTPFAVGAVIIDITVEGATGPFQICLASSTPTLMWHWNGSSWDDITDAEQLIPGQVCGTTMTLSPIALADQATAVTYTGDPVVLAGGTVNLSAIVAPGECTGSIQYRISDYLTSHVYDSGWVDGPTWSVPGSWPTGVYQVEVSYAGSDTCAASSDTSATLTVAGPGTNAYGGGWYTDSGRANFGVVVQAMPKGSPTKYKGQLVWNLKNNWRFKGTLNDYRLISSTQATAVGVGDLYKWVVTDNVGSWVLAKAGVKMNVTLTATQYPNTKKKTGGYPGKFDIRFEYTPAGASSSLRSIGELKGGNIKLS